MVKAATPRASIFPTALLMASPRAVRHHAGLARLNRSCAGVSHARPCRPLSWLCLALDRHVGWPHLRAQRREGAAAAAPSWLSPDQRDVAPRGPGAVGAFQPDHSRFARLWLVRRAAIRCHAAPYTKRAMAAVMIEAMAALGH